jgi:hypothetical protein
MAGKDHVPPVCMIPSKDVNFLISLSVGSLLINWQRNEVCPLVVVSVIASH